MFQSISIDFGAVVFMLPKFFFSGATFTFRVNSFLWYIYVLLQQFEKRTKHLKKIVLPLMSIFKTKLKKNIYMVIPWYHAFDQMTLLAEWFCSRD